MNTISIAHRELYLIYKSNNLIPLIERKKCVLQFLLREYGLRKKEAIQQLKIRLERSFFNNLIKRISVGKTKKRGYVDFELSNSSWLRENFVFKFEPKGLEPVASKYDLNNHLNRAPERSLLPRGNSRLCW